MPFKSLVAVSALFLLLGACAGVNITPGSPGQQANEQRNETQPN